MSIGLTSSELSDIRADIDSLMPDTCTIQQVSTSQDEVGQAVRSYSSRATDVKCRLDQLSGPAEEYGIFGALLHEDIRWILTLPHNQTVDPSDRVVIDSETYEIVSVDSNKSWKASTRCFLREINT